MKKATVRAYIGYAVAAILVLGSIAFGLYLYIKYGNTPVSELPAWVAVIFFAGRRK